MSDHHVKIGAALRDARQSYGLSLDEVAERIHIRPVYLQAIEGGQFELLPAVPQRLGFTRCYADFLQADLGDDLRKLSEEVNSHVSQADYSAPELLLPETRRGWGLFGVAAVLMALVAGGVFYYSGTQTGDVAQGDNIPPAAAALPSLDKAKDKAADTASEKTAPAETAPVKAAPENDQSEAPAKTDLAQAGAPALVAVTKEVAAPAIATEAHAAPKEAAPDPLETVMASANTHKAETQKPEEQKPEPQKAEETASRETSADTDTGAATDTENATQASASGTSAAAGPKTAYLASGDVYIRAQPSNGGEVIGVVNRCEPLQVIGGNRYWRHVERRNGTEGWIFTDYVAARGDAGCV